MNIEGYDAFDDPYCYPGTTVLKNLLNIQDQDTLDAFEIEISTLRAEEPLPEGIFDTVHYRAVHHHLFQDVYDWAGQYRTVRTSKGGNFFCYQEYIPAQMDALFQGLRGGEAFVELTSSAFLQEIARFLGELNAIHPFREGNGRSQMAFIGLIGANVNHPFAFERLDRTTFLPAMIASYFGNREPLIVELGNLLI
ncbi:Fic/DOC family protein [Acidicapsa dinghuensis]|uniref:protein adenylyltransferase n=1 Tax=Acidicapsa dinghuensis TaxID=2218256 RepID=A0ABW1EBV0_9BACT|nr:Fic family protein [Acidicapsa dinghuensis]